MGAFETFVNANLGIRKPLILDVGHPTGSSKAAGVIGSEYVDTENNNVYEKTGENNLEDWAFIRKLGDSLSSSESGIITKIENVQSSSSAQNFSASLEIPQNSESLNISFLSLGNSVTYLSPPKVFASMRFNSAPESIYAHAIYGVNSNQFNIQFSDEISESNCFLDILITANAGQISGVSEDTQASSVVWFEESGESLMLMENALVTEDPAIEYWEEGPNNTLIPLESGAQLESGSGQYFEQTGEYITII